MGVISNHSGGEISPTIDRCLAIFSPVLKLYFRTNTYYLFPNTDEYTAARRANRGWFPSSRDGSNAPEAPQVERCCFGWKRGTTITGCRSPACPVGCLPSGAIKFRRRGIAVFVGVPGRKRAQTALPNARKRHYRSAQANQRLCRCIRPHPGNSRRMGE